MSDSADAPHGSTAHAVLAGVVCGIVGFTSSFAVVLAGLRAVGASPTQAGSGLLVLCLTMGLGCILFSTRLRMPVTMAWSTPGAALLASVAVPTGGFATAVGAFMVSGGLVLLCGVLRPLERLVERIPSALASAMLAGVLLTLCTHPFLDLHRSPAAIGIVLAVWALGYALWRRWAVLIAFLAALVVMGYDGSFSHLGGREITPQLTFIEPHFNPMAALAIGVPLFIVTMTSQNVPGIAVLASFGYRLGLRKPLLYTGGASVVGAFGGGHMINLAAISAALAAGPDAHPDRSRRWIAGVACGITYLVFAPLAALVTTVAAHAPTGLFATIAAAALFPTFASAAQAALAPVETREAAGVAIVVAASGLTLGGIGAAFWSLVAGFVMVGVGQLARKRTT